MIPWLILERAFWAGLACLGLGMAFHVPRRALVGCMVCGIAGYLTRAALQAMGVSIEAATLGASVVLGFVGELCARWWKLPGSVFMVTGSVLLVPGFFAFRAMMGIVQVATTPVSSFLLQSQLTEASVNIIKTGLILAAIAVGTSVPGLLFFRSRPVS